MQYIFPLQATSFTESLEWKTDILEAENGQEDALKVRDTPRQEFALQAYAGKDETQAAFNLLYSGLSSQWGIPIWSEAVTVGRVDEGVNTIYLSTVDRDFRQGGYAVIWQGSTRFQLVTVDALDPAFIVIDGSTDGFENAVIVPVRAGRIKGEPTRAFNGTDWVLYVNFRIEDVAAITPAEPPQFAGYDLYFPDIGGLLEGDRSEGGFINRDDLIDFQLGKVDSFNPWSHSKVGYPYRVLLDGISEERDFREWLYRRAGKYRRFWMPTWEQDVRLVSYTSDSLTIYEDDFVYTGSIRRTIGIESSAGTWVARNIVAISEPVGGLITLTLSSALQQDVSRVSWLSLRRLSSDRVEIVHGTGGVAQVSLTTIELEPNTEAEGVLLTEGGEAIATEQGAPIAIEEATIAQQQAAGSVKISELVETTASEAGAAGAFLVVAVDGSTDYKVPISDLVQNGEIAFSINVGIVGETSFVIPNQLGTKDVILCIVDNVTGQQVGIACAISAGSISASGLSPIEVTNQFRVTVRK